MPKKNEDSFAQLYSEQQVLDQKLDLLARAVDNIVAAGDLKELRKWSETQRGVYVDPYVAKAEEALEEAREKAAS